MLRNDDWSRRKREGWEEGRQVFTWDLEEGKVCLSVQLLDADRGIALHSWSDIPSKDNFDVVLRPDQSWSAPWKLAEMALQGDRLAAGRLVGAYRGAGRPSEERHDNESGPSSINDVVSDDPAGE